MDGGVYGRTHPRRNPPRWQLLPAAGVDLVFPPGLQTRRARQTADDVSQHGSFWCRGTATDVFFGVLKPDGPFESCVSGPSTIMDGKASGKHESSDCAPWLLYVDGSAEFDRPVPPCCVECHATYFQPISSSPSRITTTKTILSLEFHVSGVTAREWNTFKIIRRNPQIQPARSQCRPSD